MARLMIGNLDGGEQRFISFVPGYKEGGEHRIQLIKDVLEIKEENIQKVRKLLAEMK